MTQSLCPPGPGTPVTRGVSWGERGRKAGISLLTGLLGVPLVGAAAAGAAPAGPDVSVIVRPAAGAEARAERSVERLGGEVGRDLDLIDSFTAEVPADAVALLQGAPGVAEVTADGSVHLQGEHWRAEKDRPSLEEMLRAADVDWAWRRKDLEGHRVTGAGVTVALIDSGVAPVEGLTKEGKVVNGVDLSFESQVDDARHLDTFGHGTHLAGIIAGDDDGRGFSGVAPDARLLNVKVAAADGATDVSQVIAALDWVVQHRTDNGMDVRVVNLAFGTNSTQSYLLDPLAHAAEVAWRHGIVVVVSAGNEGGATERLTDPAIDPYVLAVGASDDAATERRDDDRVAEFSSRGTVERTPDLVAPGRSLESLRVPGSFLDEHYPTARVATKDGNQRFFRGSGTSQSAAFVSGVAALLLQQRPELTPDQVKALLTTTADPIAGADRRVQGAGLLDVQEALRAPTPQVVQSFPVSSGTGSLEAARGGSHVADPETGVELVGEQDIFGHAWDGSSWSGRSWSGSSWSGGTWNGSSWSGSSWSGSSWSGRSWSGSSWSGSSWSGRSWSGSSWSGSSWSGRSWSGSSWSGSSWSGSSWSGRSWSGSSWS